MELCNILCDYLCHYTFGKFKPTSKTVAVKVTGHAKKKTLYSRLNDEVAKTFIMNENSRRRNICITIIKLDCSPSFLK